MHEIVDWNAYAPEERALVIGRISTLIQQVAEPVIEIVDLDQFHQALKYQHVRFDELAGPYVWLLELLKVGASTIESLEPFACRIRPAYAGRSLIDIREQIDKDFFTLSEVHYERYFAHCKPKS